MQEMVSGCSRSSRSLTESKLSIRLIVKMPPDLTQKRDIAASVSIQPVGIIDHNLRRFPACRMSDSLLKMLLILAMFSVNFFVGHRQPGQGFVLA